MPLQTLKIKGEEYVLISRKQYDALIKKNRIPAREATDAAIAKSIHEARIAKGMTQQELAQKSKVSVTTLSRIENGNLPSMRTVEKIVTVLDKAG